MSSIGSFTLVKNEAQWLGVHLSSWLPYLDEAVFFDGNSTDGTIEIIERFQRSHKDGHKIKLYLGKDPKDLRDDYVRTFNECLKALTTDYAAFLHPDMICVDPGNIRNLREGIAYFSTMESFAGNPGEQLFKITTGRADRWKNIYLAKNPDLGLHYHGWYGSADEDCYFREITGDEHIHRGSDFHLYPYPVLDSGIKIAHYSDVRSYERRLGRMETCLRNQGHSEAEVKRKAAIHPRVTLLDGDGFRFAKCEYPEIFKSWESELMESVK